MTVQEMLDELQLKYPHSYTNAQVVNRMDRLQKRIFRQLNTYDKTQMNLQGAGNDTLNASGIKPRTIRKFTIDNIEYPFWRPEEEKPVRYYYYSSTSTIKYFPPTSTAGMILDLWYYVTPTTLSANTLGATPDLDSDYHMLLVYGVAKEIAEDLRDGSMATAFAVAYNDLYNEMQQGYQDPTPKTVIELPWG